ncbi:MAG TPA: 4Fe-4S dicluster domain-containing protein [Sorangium sp.]|nr:4Fe-4S dicluster domain-containing protein [Sorangium sp.]
MHELLTAIDKGTVTGLIVVEVNPVEQLPEGDALVKKLKQLQLSVAITSRPSATAEACQLVAAAHHPLERWSDAAPQRDVLTVAQPTLRPLFDTRDPLECALLWHGVKVSPRQYIQSSWGGDTAAGKHAWDQTLSAGVAAKGVAAASAAQRLAIADTTAAADESTLVTLFRGMAAPTDALEVELLEEVGPRDGRGSFNPWLRELPDPLTRAAWTAMVRLAPSLAAANNIHDGDNVTVQVGQRSVQMQARIMPGQHPRVVGVPVGYGVRDGDGGDATRNGYRLAQLTPDGLVTAGLAATLRRTGGGAPLPLMQWESTTHERPIIHQVGRDDEAIEEGHHPEAALWGDDYRYTKHWHMVIDLDSCTGCSACVVACQAENNIAVVGPQNMVDHRDMYWLRIDRYFTGDDDNPEVLFEPMLCAQCDNAPCETVCPVAATVHSHDGLNMQAYNRCVGTRYCANNCPYKVRRFNWFDFTPKDELERLVLNPDVVVRERGVMEKCTFCVQRIQQARIADMAGKPEGATAVQTACQQSCPARAISFGDDVRDTHIQEQQHQPRAFQVLADLGVLPSLTYLARVRRRESTPESGT